MRLPCGCCELLSTTHYLLPIQPGRPAFCFYRPKFPKANIYVQREHGGRGRIRTSVARKERQIYSLLVLATHPPVLENSSLTPSASPANICQKTQRAQAKTQKGLVSKDTSPSILSLRIRSASFPRKLTGG